MSTFIQTIPMLRHLILVALGGAVGSTLRYLLSLWLPRTLPGDFPWATLTANLAGCLAIGWLMGRFGPDDTALRLLLVTGFCGGFTTFSAFGYENLQLLQDGQYLMAVSYLLISLIGGLGLVAFGYYLSATS